MGKFTSDVTTSLTYPKNDEGAFISGIQTSTSAGVLGAYSQIVAAAAHTVIGIELAIQAPTNGAGFLGHRVVIATGGSGSEVVKKTFRICTLSGTPGAFTFVVPIDQSIILKGSRVAIAVSNETSNAQIAFNIGVSLLEKND